MHRQRQERVDRDVMESPLWVRVGTVRRSTGRDLPRPAATLLRVPAGLGTITTTLAASRLSRPTIPNGATNISTSSTMARINVAGEPFSQPNRTPTIPSLRRRPTRASEPRGPRRAKAPTIGPHSVAPPPMTMTTTNVIAPMSVNRRRSGLTPLSRMPNSAPAVAVIAADTPYTIVFVRGRLTPITAAAVSLSRMAISDRPTRLFDDAAAHEVRRARRRSRRASTSTRPARAVRRARRGSATSGCRRTAGRRCPGRRR